MKELKIGRLSRKPEIREVTFTDIEGVPRKEKVAESYLYIYDRTAPLVDPEKSSTNRYGVPVKLVAWGNQAEKLSQCDKGEQITVMGSTKAVVRENNVSYGLIVSSVYRGDEGRDINRQLVTLLNAFEKKQIDKIFEMPETIAAIEKETGKNLQHETDFEESMEYDIDNSVYPDFEEVLEEDFEEYDR